jgi:hypothetical protein
MDMKRLFSLFIALTLLAFVASPALAAKPGVTGFDEWGYNYGARLFNGWYGFSDKSGTETENAWLSMKWSKDWTPQEDEPVGAWDTNHWTWYSNNYEELSWYGFNNRLTWTDKDIIPEADYKIEEFMKIQKVGENHEEWLRYKFGGAYNAFWGNYSSGDPKYVVFQDVVTVYGKSWNTTGNWVVNVELGGINYPENLVLSQTDSSITGVSLALLNGASPWTITTGSVNGKNIEFFGYFNSNPSMQVHFLGTIASDGTMSGSWNDVTPGTRVGTWTSTTGNATWIWDEVANYNLATASSKGLGKPIF